MIVGELTVRGHDGSEVAAAVRVVGGTSPAGRRAIIVLVHGYANSEDAASRSYDACIEHLGKLSAPVNVNVTMPIFKFHWPGDLAVQTLSPASYPWKIGPARTSGIRLADFLATLSGPAGTPLEVHLISHSLGGRVLLELLANLSRRQTSVVVASLSTMAAAVPVPKVLNSAQLGGGARLPRRSQALHSTDDMVLQLAFPAGETLGGDGFFPEAVGSFGRPDGVWTRRRRMVGYGHSEYWTSGDAAKLLAEFLGIPIAPSIPTTAVSTRALPAVSTIAPRALPTRTLQDRSVR